VKYRNASAQPNGSIHNSDQQTLDLKIIETLRIVAEIQKYSPQGIIRSCWSLSRALLSKRSEYCFSEKICGEFRSGGYVRTRSFYSSIDAKELIAIQARRADTISAGAMRPRFDAMRQI